MARDLPRAAILGGRLLLGVADQRRRRAFDVLGQRLARRVGVSVQGEVRDGLVLAWMSRSVSWASSCAQCR
jgi:hypothetical protein